MKLTFYLLLSLFLFLLKTLASSPVIKRPNILWIVVEDQSKHYGFNGEKLVHTPVLDELAGNGVRFTNASVSTGVLDCSFSINYRDVPDKYWCTSPSKRAWKSKNSETGPYQINS